MLDYVSLLLSMTIVILGYVGLIAWYKPEFEQEEHKQMKLLANKEQRLIAIISEIAIVRLWFVLGKPGMDNLEYLLLLLMLIAMSFFCTTDLLERVVPNKILILFVLIFLVRFGFEGVQNFYNFIAFIPAVVLGVVFCALSFGSCYLIARGSMGAGDVKLALVMGLYLTGQYVVAAILYGCVISAVFSIIQLLRHKLTRKDAIPFVPFLYIGVIIKYLLG